MLRNVRVLFTGIVLVSVFILRSHAQETELRNTSTSARFGDRGLLSVADSASGSRIDLEQDAWSITLDGHKLRSQDAQHVQRSTGEHEVTYDFDLSPYKVRAVYQLKPGWNFVSKQVRIVASPSPKFVVEQVVAWDVKVKAEIESDYVPSVYTPQFGSTIEQSRKSLPGKDYGEFLRFADQSGALLTVQNPFLEVHRNGASVDISYAPEMEWQSSWGEFSSDLACIGTYRLTGSRNARQMVTEWHPVLEPAPNDGMDKAEVAAFTACVRASLIHPSPGPISVLVGWTLNDYQIDAGTPEGRAEYKRIIDTASELGIQTLLYAPGNSQVSERTQSVDTWSWEYVLWLGMGQQIRKNQWAPEKDPIPSSVAEMLEHAKQRHVGLLAYVYPSIPYEKDPSWIVQGGTGKDGKSFGDPHDRYATLSSRALQDYLLEKLIAFKKRTGIAGYSFDYDFLNLPGSSSYAQWYGWRRVIESLRREFPSIVIDGRQSYQLYGPWSWLAGSYPHPTGTDEQPESFKPYPDLHFDRVSADRTRFVNYWYRNYQFAPEEVIPGYATHQTERSRNVPAADGQKPHAETVYSRFRPRDWDYLGYRYSFLSSIATAGWNNVVDMIPARDPEESKHFSAADKAWIRKWLDWTVQNKQYLLHAQTILEQPAMGHVDGTSAIIGDRGFLFVFNPNYKQLPADIVLDESIGLTAGRTYVIKEIEPFAGRMLGSPQRGVWTRGDHVHLTLDGTSATVFQITPANEAAQPLVFNAAALSSDHAAAATLNGTALAVRHVSGEPGTTQTFGILLPSDTRVSSLTLNGRTQRFTQNGRYIEVAVRFAGDRFGKAQEVSLSREGNGELTGTFLVPRRIIEQLAARKRAWPIPWTKEDYESTWLAPERLLLFVQAADGKDTASVTATLDGQPISVQPAYTSSRVDAPCFVGFYADLSSIPAGVRHTIKLHISGLEPAQLQGVFFDNVEPELTESIEP
ncbi:alpha-amylase family protein [Occallatibacter riparius]|uniref:Uncharacterized protein n=1 Tax=Occallatibacter riparius TaxID=1002689 RepID=A0A9J7BTB4_9BACT|nr:hypothetical protein [Occallatibacter riparius]UWZ84142.1 hypothetical protein MOP44_26750 [Occallatibacter riparius]